MQKRILDAVVLSERTFTLGGPNDRKKNLVVRLHGAGKHKHVLLIGASRRSRGRGAKNWTTDPFQFVEKDGFY